MLMDDGFLFRPACVKKIGDCGSIVASMLTRGMMSDRKDYSMAIIGALEDLCR